MSPEVRTALARSAVVLPLAIRLAEVEDLPLLEWFGLFEHHREIFTEAFARQMRGENLMLLADIGGFPVGQAWVDLVKRQPARIGYIWAVRVFPFLRNLGIGAALMTNAEVQLEELGFSIAEVGVERSNPRARRFYERLGYSVVSEISESYSYTTPAGAAMSHIVDQWLMHKRLTSGS